MKSHRHHRSRWHHANTPDALIRRRAKNDARREAIALTLPPIEPDPEPLSVWQTVQLLDAHGAVMHAITLRVPTAGRCDQHAGEVDGVRCDALVTATDVGRLVAGMICKRATFAQRCEARQ